MNSTEQATIRRHSAGLQRVLRLRDLALMQIALVASVQWVAIAAKQGPTHVSFWLLAMLFFYLPEVAVVAYLSRLFPLEGGVYQWAKLGLGPFAGFIAAWNLCLFLIIAWSPIGLTTAASIAYALGPSGAWMGSNRLIIAGLSLFLFAVIWLLNIRGFTVAKWLANTAGFITLGLFGVLIVLLLFRPGHVLKPSQPAFSFAWPALSVASINLFSKMAFNALGGLDNAAVFAGESRSPARDIIRSVWIAAPLIGLFYVLGSGSMLLYVPSEQIDLVAPIPQILSTAAGSSSVMTLISSLIILAHALLTIVQAIVCVGVVSRLPMVAGWDGLVPDWFTQLHPRYGTPSASISAVVLCCIGVGTISLLGVNEQEAFQLAYAAAFGCCGIYYLVMFSIPLFNSPKLLSRPSLKLRIAALSGISVTLLSVGFQLFPIVDVGHRLVFGAKVGIAMAVANSCGILLYRRTSNARKGLEVR